MMKPEPEVFLHLLETFKLRASESVFIDDLVANVDAARKVGMHGIVFKDADQRRDQLTAILAKLRD